MSRERTGRPRRSYELASDAAVAGVGGAAIAAAGVYGFLYGLTYQFFPLPGGSVNSGAGGTLTEVFFLLFGVAASVGGGALLSKAMGVVTWRRSTLISTVAHAVGVPLWFAAYSYLTVYPVTYVPFDKPLLLFSAAMFACVVPFIVLFSAYRQGFRNSLAITLFMAIATVALPATAVLLNSDTIAIASAVVAWVVLPGWAVLGSATIGSQSL